MFKYWLFPLDWMKANLVPVYIKDDKQCLKSYLFHPNNLALNLESRLESRALIS